MLRILILASILFAGCGMEHVDQFVTFCDVDSQGVKYNCRTEVIR